MERLYTALYHALDSGGDAVLCTVVASSGSVPRGSGAKMAVFADGTTYGTVGGGAVEFECIKLAGRALQSRESFTRGFSLTRDQTADIGMICGGQATVCFRCFRANDAAALALLAGILSQFGKRENTWLVTQLSDGAVSGTAVVTQAGSVLFGDALAGADMRALTKTRAVLQPGEPAYYAEPLTRAETVYVFGGGHVSQALVPVLAQVGFAVVVFEDRAAFVDPALFPGVLHTVTGDFSNVFAHVTVRADDYAVIMTRGHQADYEVLRQMLQTDASYIGVIGSRHKIAATNRRLMEAGVPEAALGRVHTPIGLPIGAETPAEIAVSVAAELIAHRAGLRKGPGEGDRP